jgi:hypothetical protein
MVETKWRAVAIGFVVIFALTLVSTTVQQLALLGGVVAGLVGGATAGHLADSGRRDGAWNGFLAGAVGGLVVTGLLVVSGLAVSLVELSLGGVFATIGLGIAAVLLVALGAVPATVGGYLGGAYPRRNSRPEPEPESEEVAESVDEEAVADIETVTESEDVTGERRERKDEKETVVEETVDQDEVDDEGTGRPAA